MLPHDYVNYTKITTVGSDGIEKNLYPTDKTSNPFKIKQYEVADEDNGIAVGDYGFYDSDNDGETDTLITGDFNEAVQYDSTTWENYKGSTSEQSTDAKDSLDQDIDDRGRRYGLDPQYAHEHGSFYIDQKKGYIHFSSSVSGDRVILDYISDGLGTDEEMVVHKFCEEAVYKWIAYGVLSCRTGVPDSQLMRFKMEKSSETRKAKIRLSNIKIEEFTQILRGIGKQIK